MMLPTITVLRPSRSTSHPPSSPNTPPHRAAIQSIRPAHSRTGSLCGETPRFSSDPSASPSSAAHPGELPSAFTWISSATASAPITGNISSS